MSTTEYAEKQVNYGTAVAALADLRKWLLNPKRERPSKRPRSIYVHMNVWVPTSEDKGYNCHESVQISYKEAQKLIKAMARFEDRGGKIRLCFYTDDMCFIG